MRIMWQREAADQQAARWGDALSVLQAALEAADPAAAIRRMVHVEGDLLSVSGRHYDLSLYRRVFVVGAGKAGATMVQAVEALLGDRITAGTVTVKYGYTAPTRIVSLREAGHPVPDSAGVAAAQAMVDLLSDAAADDLVLCLISGGGSALTPLPVPGISLEETQALTNLLLRSGAPIQAINTVRKHLSQIQGGQLVRLAHPARVIALILSDVVGSPLDVIASGPTVPDPSTFAEALAVLDRYGVSKEAPPAVMEYLRLGTAGAVPETVKAGDPLLEAVQNVVVADNTQAAEAAAAGAAALGFHTLLLSTFVEGEAREVAQVLVALGREVVTHGRPVAPPACLILGGETTVTMRGDGRGGRNQELALAAAVALRGLPGVAIASLATDGSDGPTEAAGALVDAATITAGELRGLSALEALAANDSGTYLEAAGDLLITGPTNTNVNDLMVVFVFE